MAWKYNPFTEELDYYRVTVDPVQDGDLELNGTEQLFVAEEYFINDTDALTLNDTSMLAVH